MMRFLLPFLVGLLLGVGGTLLVHRWASTRGEKRFYAFPRIRLATHTPANKWRPRSNNRIKPAVKVIALASIPIVFSLLVAFYAIKESKSLPTEETTPTAAPASVRPEHTSGDPSPDSTNPPSKESRGSEPPVQMASLSAAAAPSPEPNRMPEEAAAMDARPSEPHSVADILESPPGANISAPRSYPYSLKLGAFRTQAQVEKAAAFYRQMGLSPFWVKITLKDKGVWYRLFAGCFADLAKAEKFRREYGLTKALIKKTKYANLVGTYTSSQKFGAKVLDLKDQGFSPYVIESSDGTARVYVGAFLTLSGAEAQQDDLSSAQFENQVVNR
jgi:cell division septation protein DedD